MKFYIYALIDPRFPSRFYYIGCTSNLSQRLQQHNGGSHQQQLRQWIKELRQVGLSASFVVLQTFASRNRALKAEQDWIKNCRSEFLINKIQIPNVILPTCQNSTVGSLRRVVLQNAVKTLEDNGNNKRVTARILGIGRQTLYNMLKEWQRLKSTVQE